MKCLSKSKSYDDDIEEPCVSEDSGLWSHLHRRDFAREFQPEIFQRKPSGPVFQQVPKNRIDYFTLCRVLWRGQANRSANRLANFAIASDLPPNSIKHSKYLM